MTEEIIKCDICETILSIGSTKIKKKYGITWSFAHSINGWGSRVDRTGFTGEVCDQCFSYFDKLSIEFNRQVMVSRVGINKQDVTIKL